MQRVTQADIDEMRARGFDIATIAEAEAWLIASHRAVELIRLIEDAFGEVRLEEGMGLTEADAVDMYAPQAERQRRREGDEKDDWRKINAEVLHSCQAAPSFLDAKGMRFHLPAFLTAELRGTLDDGFIDRLIHDSFAATGLIGLLNKTQKDAIVQCLRFVAQLPGYAASPQAIEAAIARFAE